MLRDPASAVAVSKCLIHRLTGYRPKTLDVSSFHPEPCAWCDYPVDALRELLDTFTDWAGYDSRTDRYRQQVVEQFRAFPISVQQRMVREAQYPEKVAAA